MRRIGALLVALCAAPAPAAAQSSGAGPPLGAGPAGESLKDPNGYWPRIGFFVGLAAGFGVTGQSSWDAVDCAGCPDGALAGPYVGLDIGYRIRRRVAVVAALGGTPVSDFDPEGGDTFDFVTMNVAMLGAGMQYWIHPRISIRGILGSGIASADVQYNDISFENRERRGPGAMFSLDVEVTDWRALSLELELDGSLMLLDGEVVPVLGFALVGRYHATEPVGAP